ncbi:hypothetical protein TNCV_1412701 [Trichonephila clavipes]|nr:hypothetical protein TNCV_1412701 [Trichonephila clavipes]
MERCAESKPPPITSNREDSLQHQDSRIHVWRHRGERPLVAFIGHRHISPSPGVMVRGSIGYTSWSPLVRIDDTLTVQITFQLCYHPWLRPLFEPCETLRFNRIMQDHMLAILYRPSMIRKIFICCLGLRVHQISRQ